MGPGLGTTRCGKGDKVGLGTPCWVTQVSCDRVGDTIEVPLGALDWRGVTSRWGRRCYWGPPWGQLTTVEGPRGQVMVGDTMAGDPRVT